MNKIEAFVYNVVRNHPKLKQWVRNVYQSCFDMLPRQHSRSINPVNGKLGYFYGFHDTTPFSQDESMLLAHEVPFDFRMPLPGEEIEIGFFDINNGKLGNFHAIGISKAWNFHKGCRLQWIDNDRVIHNTCENGKLSSKIINVNTGVTIKIPYPIDAVYKDMATSFSYERLERCMPGYGYPYLDNGNVNEAAPRDTGLFLIDLITGERKLVLSLHDVAKSVTGKIEEDYLHFITHTEFSKDGKYISFLYRRIPKGQITEKRRSVICVYNRDTQKLIVLPSQESGSHYVWNNNNQIIASCIIEDKPCHVLFDINKDISWRIIAGTQLNSDGHQSFIDSNSFITDTYPDKWRMAKIYKVEIDDNSSSLIASFYSPKKFQTKKLTNHIACDLHPRISPSGKYMCFDSVHEGKRGIYISKI